MRGDVRASALPILRKKARLGEDGGSLRGEGTPFARQPKGVPSPPPSRKIPNQGRNTISMVFLYSCSISRSVSRLWFRR